jgi:zinc-binding alcohol dehydrogenase/oxidoreductase
MKAIVITNNPTEPLQLVDKPKPECPTGHCLVRIQTAGLNRRDQWIREGKYPGIRFGNTLGSDGFGVVEEGPAEWKGKEVIINPNINWGKDPAVQSKEYEVLGMPTDGTLAEYLVVPADRLHAKPAHLSAEEAAAIPLGGLTAYRALFTKGKVTKGSKVLVTGAGGGVSQIAMTFAVVAGAEVHVTSGGMSKIKRCKELGAVGGYNYREADWAKHVMLPGGFDVVVDSAGGNQINNYLRLIAKGGRIVIYGSTSGYPERLDVFRLFWTQAQLMGSTMGNDEEFGLMVKFVNEHKIKPVIDRVVPVAEYLSAFNRFTSPDHFGKIIIRF